MSTSNHVFSAFSFISFVLVSIPLPWHLQARNAATCLYIAWVSLSNFTLFINSVLWDGNVVDRSPVWCDISGRQILATFVAIPATCLCIQRLIYHFLSDPLAINTAAQKRRRIMWDVLIGLALPLLSLVLAYVVQQHRYFIYEDLGCRIGFNNFALSVALIPALRLSLGLISGLYGCLNMHHIWTRRREVRTSISFSTGGLSYNHYIRLFMLSGIDILITIPFYLWSFTPWFPLVPWPGWTSVHSDWSRIPIVTAAEWRSTPSSILMREFGRWISVIYGLIFFIFFGLRAEIWKDYASAWKYASKWVCWQTRSSRESFRRSESSYSTGITFAENSAVDKSDYLGSSYVVEESTVVPSITFDTDSKLGSESDFVTLSGLTSLAPISQQYCRTSIPLLLTPSDLESRGGPRAQSLVLKDPEIRLEV